MELIIDFVLVGGVLTTLDIHLLLVKTEPRTLPNRLLPRSLYRRIGQFR